MRNRKASVWLSLGLAGLLALAPALAEARAGGGSSSGSRGSRTYQAPAPTPTAPQQAQPMQRSTTPTQPAQAQRPAQPTPATQGGFFQRNPFLGGLMGGLLGAGLIGMLMGGGFMGAGMAGMLGMIMQIALIGGLIYLAMMLFRRRRTAEAPAGAPASYAYDAPQQDQPVQRSATPGLGGGMLGGGLGGMMGGSASPRRSNRPDEIGIKQADFQIFEQLLGEVQMAWSKGDMGRLKQLMTPEMAGYFAEELSANAARGIVNHVEDGRLEQGDLSEAWREGDDEYATVAMRFSLLDYGKRISDGKVVEGSDTVRTEATEIWTMVRPRGGTWILSAIQQVN